MFRGLVVSGDSWFSSSDYARHRDNWPLTTDLTSAGLPWRARWPSASPDRRALHPTFRGSQWWQAAGLSLSDGKARSDPNVSRRVRRILPLPDEGFSDRSEGGVWGGVAGRGKQRDAPLQCLPAR